MSLKRYRQRRYNEWTDKNRNDYIYTNDKRGNVSSVGSSPIAVTKRKKPKTKHSRRSKVPVLTNECNIYFYFLSRSRY